MTVATTINRRQYDGNGATWAWTYDFPIIADTDLVVITTDSLGADTTRVCDVDYLVTGVGNSTGGTVEYPIGGSGTILPTGSHITIVRSVPILQPENILNQGAVVPSRWMAMADRLTLVSQDLQEQLERALLSPVTAPGSETALTETAADLRYMKLAGGTFTGAPSYAADPASANVLCRRSYVTGNYVPLAGGVTLSGHLSRAVDPTLPNHLARKSYVDSAAESFLSSTQRGKYLATFTPNGTYADVVAIDSLNLPFTSSRLLVEFSAYVTSTAHFHLDLTLVNASDYPITVAEPILTTEFTMTNIGIPCVFRYYFSPNTTGAYSVAIMCRVSTGACTMLRNCLSVSLFGP